MNLCYFGTCWPEFWCHLTLLTKDNGLSSKITPHRTGEIVHLVKCFPWNFEELSLSPTHVKNSVCGDAWGRSLWLNHQLAPGPWKTCFQGRQHLRSHTWGWHVASICTSMRAPEHIWTCSPSSTHMKKKETLIILPWAFPEMQPPTPFICVWENEEPDDGYKLL